jgi:hypothetical protein
VGLKGDVQREAAMTTRQTVDRLLWQSGTCTAGSCWQTYSRLGLSRGILQLGCVCWSTAGDQESAGRTLPASTAMNAIVRAFHRNDTGSWHTKLC